jgi:hypothetical protein
MGAGPVVKGTLFILGLMLLEACNDSGSSPGMARKLLDVSKPPNVCGFFLVRNVPKGMHTEGVF